MESGCGKFVEDSTLLKVSSADPFTSSSTITDSVLSTVEPKTNVKSMLSSKNFRPYIYKYGEVVSRFSSDRIAYSILMTTVCAIDPLAEYSRD